MDDQLLRAAQEAPGFMPAEEGLALARAAEQLTVTGPLLEVGSYLGKSTLYLAAAARPAGRLVVTVDHHRGSEEHQPGWSFHDPTLVDERTGRVDTLPGFRTTIASAGAEDVVVAVVARSEVLADLWGAPLAFLFLDGSHTEESATRDFRCWLPHLRVGGVLALHDVFADPAEGGQAPYHVYQQALATGMFTERAGCGSLRLLHRTGRPTRPESPGAHRP